jgi:hypothetical protein
MSNILQSLEKMMFNKKRFICLLFALFCMHGVFGASESSVGKVTEITSDRLEMENKESGNHFRFYDNVRVLGDNLSVACNYLEVVSERAVKNKASAPVAAEAVGAPQMGAIMKITAKDHVRIEQAGRVATCGLAEIFPRDGKLILTESPILTDANGRVEGHRIVLFKDERRAIVDPYPQGGRTKVVLPSIPDLGFKNVLKQESAKNSETNTQSADQPAKSTESSSSSPRKTDVSGKVSGH